jgi:transcription elongation factor GreA
MEEFLMGTGNVYLSHEGYEKLRKELEHLKTTKRREISKAIGEARAHGDISENAEYTYSKEAQGLNEKKIAELEEKLSRAKLIDESAMSRDEILIGARVKLKDMDSAEELEYSLVAEEEADYSAGKISITSPVGEALLGHKENDMVRIIIPAGMLRYKVLKISRE